MPSVLGRLTLSVLFGASLITVAPRAIRGGNDESAEVTARDKEHWAFRHVRRPAVPVPRNAVRATTPIDAFLLKPLEASGFSFSPPADRTTLLRRAFLDLHGLPPTPKELTEFLADSSPDAFAREVERLLASPRFGERWGRHWLDVVGYADTVGFDSDANGIFISEGKWKYRDYVIRSFNADKPYDRFLVEQLAGDELVDWRHALRFTDEIREDLIATGYLRTARDQTHEPESNIPLNYYGVLHDTVEVLGNSLFALTVNCARCHTHKFDPIPQRDYYRLMALFTPAYNPENWKPVFPWKPEIRDRALPDASTAELSQIDRFNADVDRDVARMRGRMAEPGCTSALKTKLMQLVSARSAQRRRVGRIQAMYDVGPPPVTHLLKRGQFETPGPVVQAGFLSVLCDSSAEAVIPERQEAGPESGRRLAFARWVTRKNSRAAGLVARVFVNRIWQHLFGEGLVRTPENFGVQGEEPTHPELLEWLSAEFQGPAGWRTKPLVRAIMLSAAYQQASQSQSPRAISGQRPDAPSPPTPLAQGARGERAPARLQNEALSVAQRGVARTSSPLSPRGRGAGREGGLPPDPFAVDPENRLLWRMRTKRLEAEAIRDCVLAAGGRLDSTMGGPPILLIARPDGLVTIDASKLRRPGDADRRSVYLLSRRAYNLSLFNVFDRPLFAVNCPKRDTSVIPLQSLTMLNDEFIAEQADHLASRVATAARLGSEEQAVRSAFVLALAREPSATESRRCVNFLNQQERTFQGAGAPQNLAFQKALAQLCRTLYNTSEFLYSE
jgi:Protein of unknown function (DUF1549)/Protein of unknown function (DUF1553)